MAVQLRFAELLLNKPQNVFGKPRPKWRWRADDFADAGPGHLAVIESSMNSNQIRHHLSDS